LEGSNCDYCITGNELNKIKTGIIINNSNGFEQFTGIIKKYDNARIN
jgi:hypothetical protein